MVQYPRAGFEIPHPRVGSKGEARASKYTPTHKGVGFVVARHHDFPVEAIGALLWLQKASLTLWLAPEGPEGEMKI